MAVSSIRPLARGWVAIGLGIAWLLSLGFPAAHLADGDSPEGFAILLVGWIGVFALQPAWLGNIFLCVALPLVASRTTRSRTLRIVGILMLICGIAAGFWADLPDDSGANPILAYGAGYYLWMLAICGTGIAALAFASMKQPRG